MNDLRIMYGPANTALPRPAPREVKTILDDYAKASENALLVDIKKQLAEVLERLAALERKSKRGRRRK